MRLRSTLLSAFVMVLAPAAPALAAGGTENFDAIAAGTEMSQQVAGLRFGEPPPGAAPGARPLVVRESLNARSGTRVAGLEGCVGTCRTFVHFAGPWPTVVRAWAGTDGVALQARMRAYDGRGRLVAEQALVRVAQAAHTQELVVQSDKHIAYVEIEKVPDPRSLGSPTLTIDDFAWNDPLAPLPGFQGAVTATSNGAGPLTEPAKIRAGRTFEWTVKLAETGGAYGNRRFTVTGVPDETPDEIPLARVTINGQNEGVVTDATELTVRVTVLEDLPQPTDATEEQPFGIELVAEPVSQRAGASTIAIPLGTLRVRPNVTDDGFGPNVAFGGSCGANSVSGTYTVKVPFSFADGQGAPISRRFQVEPRIVMTQQAIQAGLSFTITPQQATLDLDKNERAYGFDVRVTRTKPVTELVRLNIVSEVRNAEGAVVGSDAALSEVVVRPDVAPPPVEISLLTTLSGRTPQLAQPGTEVTILGSGFCPGAEVRFGNALAISPAVVNPQGTAIVTSVPRLATTGPVTVRVGALEATSSVFTVDSFRNTRGYPFANFFLDDLEFKDTENLYGYDATHIDSLDKVAEIGCTIFSFGQGDCDVEIGAKDPAAMIHHLVVDTALSGDEGDAHCFGMAVTTRQMLAGKVKLAKYGAKQIFDIAGPGGLKQGGIRRYLRAQHGAQLSAEFINDFLGYYLKGQIGTTNEVVNRFLTFFKAGVAPVVAMGQGGSGHVVVAYDLERINKDEWWVYVYDPNDPFVPTGDKADPGDKFVEESSKEGGTHALRVNGSRIRLRADNRWTYAPLNYGPGKYEGSSHRLMVFDGAKLKVRPTIPTSLKGLMHVVFGAGAVTTDAGGRKSVPFGSYEGRELAAEAFAPGSRPVVRTIRPRGSRYGSYVAGQGFSAAVVAEKTTRGESDRLTLEPPGRLTLKSTATSRRFGIVASRRADKTSRMLRVVGKTARGASTVVGIDRAGIATIRAGAATTLRLTLFGGAEGKGNGSVRKLPPLAVKRGATVRISPTSWADVDRAVVMRIKQAGRSTVTRRLRAVRP